MARTSKFEILTQEADAFGTPRAFAVYHPTLIDGLSDFAAMVRRGTDPSLASREAALSMQKNLDRHNTDISVEFAARGFDLAGKLLGRPGFANIEPAHKSSLLGIEFSRPPEMIGKYLNTKLSQWIQASSTIETATSADRYETLWRRMVEAGITDSNALGRAIMDFGLADTQSRARLMARTTSIYSYNAGALEQYTQAGVEEKEWLVTIDDATCETCKMMDGRREKVGNPFEDAGAKVGTLTIGMAIDNPPLHPNCRCCLVPVV